MNKQTQHIDMGFTQEIIPDCHHMCLIYDSEEQRRKIVSAFLASGLKHGELVRYFADVTLAPDVRDWFQEMGMELPDATMQESFSIFTTEAAYYPGGRFVPQDVLDRMSSRFAMARDAGYSASRVTAEMTWVLRSVPGADRLLEYENGLNRVHETFPYIGMCQYDARLFDGATLFKVLQVHPYMIAQGQIVRNPFYIKPEEFLTKFQANA